MKEFSISRFSGINDVDPLDTLRREEATDLRNVRLTKESLQKRLGVTDYGTGLDAGIVVRQGCEVASQMVLVQGTKTFKGTGGAFSDLGITVNASSLPKFIEFPGAATYTVAPATTETGIITNVGSNGMSIEASGEAYTVNQYVGYFCKITNGDAEGQIRMITANTATELFFAESLDPLPVATNAYSILKKLDSVVYFFDGVGTSRKNLDSLATVAWTALPTAIKLEIVGTYRNRLVGAEKDSPRLYVSSLYNGEDFKYWFEPGNSSYNITAVEIVGDQIVVHKGDGGIFITEGNDPSQWEFTERTTSFGAVNDESVDVGENIHFFVSDRGIEWFNPLETDLLEGHRCLSSYRVTALGDGTYDLANAKCCSFDSKFFCAVKHSTTPNLTNNRVFVFDAGIYLQRKQEGISSRDLPFLVDSGFEAECVFVYDGQIYFGGTGEIRSYSGTTDDGSAIESFWEKDGIDIKMPDRNKSLRQVHILSSGGSSSARLDIEDETDLQTKNLQQTALDSNAKAINGKRTKGKVHKIKLTLTNLLTARIEKFRAILDLGKL